MRTISNQIIEAMPIGLVNEFRVKAIYLMSDLIEELEMRFDTLTTEEVNFLKVLQSDRYQFHLLKLCRFSGPILHLGLL